MHNPLPLIQVEWLVGIGCKILINPYLAPVELINSYHFGCNLAWSKSIEDPLVANEHLFEQIEHFKERNLLNLLQHNGYGFIINLDFCLLIV